MIQVACEITLMFWLCILFFYCIVVVKCLDSDKKKDLNFLSDEKVFRKHYRLEDFFWTGSGSDPETENLFTNETYTGLDLVEPSLPNTWKTTTVFHTTTILFATVFSNTEGCIDTKGNCIPQVSPVQTESINFSLPTFTPKVPEILPCPTHKIHQTGIFEFSEGFYTDNEIEASNTFGSSSSLPPIKKTDKGQNEFVFPKTALDISNLTTTTVFPKIPQDKKYWIMTVLRNDFSPNIELNLTENKLSSLYRKAFSRKQEIYFGENDLNLKERKLSQSVQVHILNVTRTGNNVEIIYFVNVAGEPVPAMTAANDMRLMTVSEVIAELGYPILSKAEPYVKNEVPLGARVRGRTRDTWLLIGSVIAAVILLIILAVLFALGLSKNRTKRSTKEISKRKQIFEDPEDGRRNLAFESDSDFAKESGKHSRNSRFQQEDSKSVITSKVGVKFIEEPKSRSTSSSCSGSSEASLVRLRHQQKRKEKRLQEGEGKPKPKPRTRIRKVENSDFRKNFKRHAIQSASSAISRDTFNERTTEGYDEMDYSPRMTKSPTSYLSMPSVRAFPRYAAHGFKTRIRKYLPPTERIASRGTKIPEPLNKILEPTSIRHLDADSDSPNECIQYTQIRHEVDVEQVCEEKNALVKKGMTRHASLEGDDPGFIGPVVWNRHCQNIDKRETVNIDEIDENVNIGRMRKRFTELLDDALSIFGSRNGSPERSEIVRARQSDNRVHSAAMRSAIKRSVYLSNDSSGTVRPKTTGSKRPQPVVTSGPRGAWGTPSCSTLARSDTAANIQKSSHTIDKNLIYVNSDLPPRDPAIPLIAAIKSELKKFENSSNDNP